MEQKRHLSSCKEVKTRLHLVPIDDKKDGKNWCVKMTEEMEAASASGSGQRMFKLIRNPGEGRTSAGETVWDGSGEPILGKQQRIKHWAENFKDQFGCGGVNVFTPMIITTYRWEMSFDSPNGISGRVEPSTAEEGKISQSWGPPPGSFETEWRGFG